MNNLARHETVESVESALPPRRLRAIDLFCCSGGASRGLQLAGFHVTGVDIDPQPRYIGDRFIQADVLSLDPALLADFDLIWASPPCQALSAMKALHNAKPHLNLIPQTRELLKASGRPYIIENVVGAREHLIEPVMLCGTTFGLGAADRELQRHRLFETSFPIEAPACRHSGRPVLGIYGGHVRDRRRPQGENHVSGSNLPITVGCEAMGMPWASGQEISEAIPPAYSEHLARQFLRSAEEPPPAPAHAADDLPLLADRAHIDATKPFRFEDLHGEPEPEAWGPTYSKPGKQPRASVESAPPAPPLSAPARDDDLPVVAYCVTAKQAEVELRAVLDDADGGLIGLDIETAPTLAEADRLRALELRQAALNGELRAAKKAKAPGAEIAALEAEHKLLKSQIKYAKTAALDPHRARIRLVQAYGGGDRVAVIDLFRTGPGVLRLLNGLDIVAHNSAFEVAHLEHAGVELGAVHCSMQMARLTLGERSMKLADAVKAHLGVELDKTEQTGDWSAPKLSDAQLGYAGLDAVMAFRLAERILPVLGPQTPAYEIQTACTPACARMKSRGILLDLDAHADLMLSLEAKRLELGAVYKQACIDSGRAELAAKAPTTPALKRAALEAILSSEELRLWQRTRKTGVLSTARSDLRRADGYPPIKALIALSRFDKLLSAFGPTLTALVSPVTGRIHANYRVAADATGRASCSGPNIQQIPRTDDDAGIDFRALFKAADGCKLVGGDYAYHEMRAAAAISGDQRMTAIFIAGEDPHLVTACGMLGKRPEDLTEDERKAARQGAKPINFGAIYGCGPGGLAAIAWKNYGALISEDEAAAWLLSFARTYPEHARWRAVHADQCERERQIVMGKDAGKGVGRIFPFSRLRPGKRGYTESCNYPVQGATANSSMLALEAIDQLLFEHGIDGGPVIWMHDEIVLEVPEADALKAKELLEKAMTDAFAQTFPGAPLNGLVKAKIGATWSDVK